MAQKKNLPTSFASWFVSQPSVTQGWVGNHVSDASNYYYTYYPKTITNQVDEFFDRFWEQHGKPLMLDDAKLPRTNAYEDVNGIHIDCLIPFASKDDIKITLDPVVNSVKIEVEAHQDENDGREYHLKEISRTSFKRTFVVDKRFEVSKGVANFENSILTIEIPYSRDSEKKTLTIK